MFKNQIYLSCLVVIGALVGQAPALAATPTAPGSSLSTPAATEAATPAAQPATPRPATPARRSHLRFKSVDGSCSCTCASGGTSEQEIQQAQVNRQRTLN